jgi:hypothetical protein
MKPQQFFYKCPHCSALTNQVQVASQLHDDVLIAETARRHGRRQTPHAGPGRPAISRCPGCDCEMSTAELREHRTPCVHARLQKLYQKHSKIRLSPKDPDPYPDFAVAMLGEEEVKFEKLSSDQHVPVEIRKIAEITDDGLEDITHIRLLGRIHWDESINRWRFAPTRIGRPSTLQA